MQIVIASNRQLPIRYVTNEQCRFKRGIHYPIELTLPFFVEVEIQAYQLLFDYLENIYIQYTSCAIEVFSEDIRLLEELKIKHPTGKLNLQLLTFTYTHSNIQSHIINPY